MSDSMVDIRLRHLVEDRDRHGNVRLYVRVPGRKKVRIKGVPGSPEFMQAYHAALDGLRITKTSVSVVGASPGSLGALCLLYYASAEFRAFDKSTQSWRRRALNRVCIKDGSKPAALLQPKHVRALRDELADTPGAANIRLKALKALYAWAVEAREVDTNPTLEVKLLRYKTKGFHTWTIDEVEIYEKRHPRGTKPRLALDLLLYTACRREDAPRLGRQHIKKGRIRFIQGKNEDRAPVEMDIPVHPDLAASINATPTGHLNFLVTEYGKPFSTAGFGNKFRDWCDQAGLKHCSAHGLRKATAVRLAERGATAHEIMSITGHQSLEEVERYTKAARQAKLADRAMAKLSGAE